MQQIVINVDGPDDLLSGYGAGALIRVERDTVAAMSGASEITTIAIVTGTVRYEYWDATGASTHYYRTRYSKASPSVSTDYSDYSDVFRVSTPPLAYVTPDMLKLQLGITDASDDGLLGLICGRVCSYIESTTKQPIGPIASTTYLYDGDGLTRLFTPTPVDAATLGIGGLRAISLLEVAPTTAGTFVTLASTDYFLRGRKGVVGPYRWVCLSDQPAGSYTTFPKGRATVRITATAGWSEIPEDLTEAALNIAKVAWNAHQHGDQSVIGMDESGVPVIQNYVGGRDRETLKRYRIGNY